MTDHYNGPETLHVKQQDMTRAIYASYSIVNIDAIDFVSNQVSHWQWQDPWSQPPISSHIDLSPVAYPQSMKELPLSSAQQNMRLSSCFLLRTMLKAAVIQT
jgi:hypothetical protein